MLQIKRERLIKKINIVLWIFIFLYPLVNSFLGIDLGDTGTHYLNFKNLFSNPEIVGYSSFLTSLVGWGWLQVFGGLGIWGLNLLEVFLEWGLSLIVYFFLKKYLENTTFLLIGILISIISTGCYLNVFNYHQFSVLLITLMLIFIFKSITQDKILYSCVAGLFCGLAIGARISSLSCIACILIYVFWFCLEKNATVRKVIVHIFCFLLFSTIICAIILLIIHTTGLWQDFIKSMSRLGTMSSDTTGAYFFPQLLSNLIIGNLKTVASGILTIAAGLFFAAGFNIALKKCTIKKEKIIRIFASIIIFLIALYLGIYAYDVNPVGGSPQYTTGPNYLAGILYSTVLILLIYELYSSKLSCEKIILYIISVLLPLLIVAGSNTQTKHIILSMWFLAPITVTFIGRVFIYGLKHNIVDSVKIIGISLEKYTIIATVCFCVLLMGYKFLHMVYWTNNFDSTNRLEITQSVNSPVVKYLKTTDREADALNDIIQYMKQAETLESSNSMLVFGQGINLYNILEEEPFIRPWVTNDAYSTDEFANDLKNKSAASNNDPLIIYCRTNQYFGFAERDYQWQLSLESETTYDGKKDVLKNFLNENEYRLVMENDYYYVFSSESEEEGIEFEEYNTWF